ncbi:MAG: type 4a pilus biogenesis protein PilO [Phycisphaerales bacterium]|nr:type 4a pilus biogenesis protein PilO [Phycisphaerales bacterium]
MQFGIRELVLFLTVLLLPVVSYMLVFRPQSASIESAKIEIAHKQEMLSKLRIETARNDDLQLINEQIIGRIHAMESMLPSNKEVDQIVRQVSGLAIESGLSSPTLKSIKPLAAAQFREQPLEMSIEGSWSGFYEFLLKIEQMPRITRIIDLKVEDTSSDDSEIKASFTLSIFFRTEVTS